MTLQPCKVIKMTNLPHIYRQAALALPQPHGAAKQAYISPNQHQDYKECQPTWSIE